MVARQLYAAVVQRGHDAPHRLLGVVLHVLHVRDDDVDAEVLDHPVELLDALLVGRDLRPHVGDVLVRVAGRVPGAGESRAEVVLEEAAAGHAPVLHHAGPVDQPDVVEQPALLVDVRREPGGIYPGVMPPTSA